MPLKPTVILVLLSLISLVSTHTAQPIDGFSTSVIGGTKAINGQFPWTVFYNFSIGPVTTASCMGNLIAPSWILTAAHCLYGRSGLTINAYAGSVNLFDTTLIQKRTSQTYFVNPSYNPQTISGDLALIQLSTPFTLSSGLSTIGISLNSPTPGEIYATAGFGLTQNNNIRSVPYDNLQYVNLPYIDPTTCTSKLKSQYIQTTMICAGGTASPQADTCNGDSGSGLIRTTDVTKANSNQGLVGMTSFGSTICANGIPGVYSWIAPFYYSFIVPRAGAIPVVLSCTTKANCPKTQKYACKKNVCVAKGKKNK
eukprot:TRINITY_DN10336_c0_g1_i1.p1 TRINITY_DN10336_c0_g1~~TRINITY_DN10336_c0_g1_i1.p1  ORF type:complete len:311 (+),score=16.25 TRINITY_DN10336_c0_g1_i1:129-1061(+)